MSVPSTVTISFSACRFIFSDSWYFTCLLSTNDSITILESITQSDRSYTAITPWPSHSASSRGLATSSTVLHSSASPQLTSTLESTSSLSTNIPATTALTSSTSVISTDATESTASTTGTAASSARMTTPIRATGAPHKQELGTGAIAGIATTLAVVAALIVGYLAHLFVIKRKEKQRRRRQRFSTLFPPGTNNDNAGVYLKQSTEAVNSKSQISWPSPAHFKCRRPFHSPRDQGRPSGATSIDDDIEVQNQDVPILRSLRARRPARSLSSMGAVERTATLKLSKVKPYAETPPSARIPLTPVYDNGTFEPTVRQGFEDLFEVTPGVTNQRPQAQRSVALNFSRSKPSLTRTSPKRSLPSLLSSQMQQQNTYGRFPVKVPPIGRQKSQISNWSVSVYTDIEEDERQEQESEEQIGGPQPNPAWAVTSNPPLKDLQWSQIPRSAVIAKKAERAQSQRAAMIIQVVPSSDITSSTTQPAMGTRDQMVSRGRSFLITDTSSSEILSIASASPVFPMPPATYQRKRAQTQLTLAWQVSDAL